MARIVAISVDCSVTLLYRGGMEINVGVELLAPDMFTHIAQFPSSVILS